MCPAYSYRRREDFIGCKDRRSNRAGRTYNHAQVGLAGLLQAATQPCGNKPPGSSDSIVRHFRLSKVISFIQIKIKVA
jgi:hypothetical protein